VQKEYLARAAPPPFYTQDATLRETRSPTVPRPSTVTSKTPVEPLRARAASPPSDLVELVPRRANVGVKAKTLPFARCLRQSRCNNGGKATGSFHPSSNMLQDEGLRRGRPIPRPRPTRRPTRNSAHCNRSRAAECITGLICKGFSVMTVCNPAL
jgi:hypothetical protein